MLRGMDKRDIFMDDMDRLIFTKIIERVSGLTAMMRKTLLTG